MEGIIEKFTINISDREFVIGAIDSGEKKRLRLTAKEALELLNVLKTEEDRLGKMAEIDDAFKDGNKAAHEHGDIKDNPFQPNTPLWKSWNEGFKRGDMR